MNLFKKKSKLPPFIDQEIPFVVRGKENMLIVNIPTDMKQKEAAQVGHLLLSMSQDYDPYSAQKIFNRIFSKDKQLKNAGG